MANPTTNAAAPVEAKAEKKITLKSDLPKNAKPEEVQAHKNRAMGEARSYAQSRLIENHRAEFNTLVAEQAKVRGYDWTPAPTAEEKALAEAKALLAAHPDLVKQLGLVNQPGLPG